MKLALPQWTYLLVVIAIIFPAQLRADLPPDAQAAVKKGLLAAKEQEWEIAIQSFQDARKLAPDAPEIYGYLGLAESKMPGRELRAICWYGAYLTATTNAPNAAAIKDAIAGLQIKNEGNIRRLIQAVQDADSALPDAHGKDIVGNEKPADFDRLGALEEVAKLWAHAGNSAEAIKICQHIGDAWHNDGWVNSALPSVLSDVVRTLAESGYMSDAVKTIQLIEDPQIKMYAAIDLYATQAEAGDASGAKASLLIAQESAAGDSTDYKSQFESNIATAQAKAGDIRGAQATLVIAQKAADHISDVTNKCYAEIEIAKAQAEAGDIRGAQKTAELITDANGKHDTGVSIALAQVKAGDFVGARKTAERTADADFRSLIERNIASAQSEIARAQTTPVQPAPTRQPTVSVSDWIGELDSTYSGLNVPWFLDLSSYLKSLPSSAPKETFDNLVGLANRYIEAKKGIDDMLTRQAKQQSKP